MLTKTLHTITAVTNVARHLRDTNAVRLNGTATDAVTLTKRALSILGYQIDVANAMHADETVRRCVDAVAKFL
jgi:hypothetical protein